MLSDLELRQAEQRWRRYVTHAMHPSELALEIERWEQERDLAAADLAAEDFRHFDADTLRGGVAYAETRLRELESQAHRLLRARVSASVPVSADFDRAKYANLVGLAETLTGQEARRRGNRWLLRCPFHDDHKPSLVIYLPGEGWHCFGCGLSGQDAASFAAEFFKCSQVEGLHWVEQLCDLPSASYA